MEFIESIKTKVATMSTKDLVKLGLKTLSTMSAIELGKQVAEKTSSTTGLTCGVAVWHMNNSIIDDAVETIDKCIKEKKAAKESEKDGLTDDPNSGITEV